MAATLLLLDYHHPHQYNHADHLLMSSCDNLMRPNGALVSAHTLPSPHNHADNIHVNHHDRHINHHVKLVQQHPSHHHHHHHHTVELNASLASDHSDHNRFIGDSKDLILRAFDPRQSQQPKLQHAGDPPMARCIALDQVLTGLDGIPPTQSSLAVNHGPGLDDQGLKEQMSSKLEGAHAPLLADKGKKEVELRGRRASSSTNPLKVSRSRKSSRARASMRRSGILVMKHMASTSSQFQTTSVARDLYTAFALILVVGITTLAQKTSLLANPSRTICSRCDGFGVEPCHICRGSGFVSWEGKFKRLDPCPLCLGSSTKKCSTCGGVRVKKGVPPFLRQLAEVRARKSRP